MGRSSIILFSTILAVCGACNSPSPYPFPPGVVTIAEVQRPEGVRKYHVYVPTTYDYRNPRPLHLCYHGLNDNCGHMMAATGLKQLAEKYNFVLVTPCASFGDLGWAWNSGRCCGFLPDSQVDDFAFTDDIVNNLQGKMCIDRRNVVASGFSNGAMMAEVLGCKRSNTFRAVASVSGVVELRPGNQGGLDLCDKDYSSQSRRISVLNIHGTLDPLVPWDGDEILGFPPVTEDIERWAKRNGCEGAPVQTFKNGPYSNQVYQTCNQTTQIELVKHEGGGHEWPIDKYFDTTTYVFDFFNRTWHA